MIGRGWRSGLSTSRRPAAVVVPGLIWVEFELAVAAPERGVCGRAARLGLLRKPVGQRRFREIAHNKVTPGAARRFLDLEGRDPGCAVGKGRSEQDPVLILRSIGIQTAGQTGSS